MDIMSQKVAIKKGEIKMPDIIQKLPEIPFGKHSITRLIAGGNPIDGGSHQIGRWQNTILPLRRWSLCEDAESKA
jgi:hypothetical protein